MLIGKLLDHEMENRIAKRYKKLDQKSQTLESNPSVDYESMLGKICDQGKRIEALSDRVRQLEENKGVSHRPEGSSRSCQSPLVQFGENPLDSQE